jgi:hypothetical protein
MSGLGCFFFFVVSFATGFATGVVLSASHVVGGLTSGVLSSDMLSFVCVFTVEILKFVRILMAAYRIFWTLIDASSPFLLFTLKSELSSYCFTNDEYANSQGTMEDSLLFSSPSVCFRTHTKEK